MVAPISRGLSPTPGDIVWCAFPWHSGTAQYARPCLVLAESTPSDAIEGTSQVYQIIYGTTTRIDQMYLGDFVIHADDSVGFKCSGLKASTKFCFSRVCSLDYNSENFPPSPRISHLTADGRAGCGGCVLGLLAPSFFPLIMRAKNDYTHALRVRAKRTEVFQPVVRRRPTI